MMSDIKGMELNMNDLNQVAGGGIVNRGFFYDYWVINDETGEVLSSDFLHCEAFESAIKKGVSRRMIDEEEYNRKYNK